MYVKPQKAKPAEPKNLDEFRKNPEKFLVEYKFDGHRRYFEHEVSWSSLNLPHQHREIQAFVPPGMTVDGEIIKRVGRTTSHEVGHLLSHDPSQLCAVVFDITEINGQSCMAEPQWWRRRQLEKLLDSIGQEHHGQDWIRLSRPVVGTLEEMIERAGQEDLEGLMFKKLDKPYAPGSRSAWWKWKFTETYDVVIVDMLGKPSEWRVRPGQTGTDGVLYPEGRHTDPWLAGYVGLRYGYYDQAGKLRVVGDLGFTGPAAELQPYIGKVVELKSFGSRYETGCLRHPCIVGWRDGVDLDAKDPGECVFDFND